jgi:hypothetical protein
MLPVILAIIVPNLSAEWFYSSPSTTSSCAVYDGADASGSSVYSYVGRYDSGRYVGVQCNENATVCEVSFWLYSTDGDVDSKTYTAYIYELSSNTITPASPLETSLNTVAGTTITSSDTKCTFQFNPTSVTSGNHCIVISTGETDGTNFSKIRYVTPSGDSDFGYWGVWSDVGSRTASYVDRDFYYEVSTQ